MRLRQSAGGAPYSGRCLAFSTMFTPRFSCRTTWMFSRGSPVAFVTASRIAAANVIFCSSVRPLRMSTVTMAMSTLLVVLEPTVRAHHQGIAPTLWGGAFNDSDVAFSRADEMDKRGLVVWMLVRIDRLLQAVELDDDKARRNALFVGPCGYATREDAAAVRNDRIGRGRDIALHRGRVGNGLPRDDPIALGHSRTPAKRGTRRNLRACRRRSNPSPAADTLSPGGRIKRVRIARSTYSILKVCSIE